MAEAERRIEEARRVGAESLNLGDLVLRELPASLGSLLHLKTLHLGVFDPSKEGDDQADLDRVNRELADLVALSSLQGLQLLDLSGCEGVIELAPLASLHGLQSLNLGGCESVTQLAPVASLQGLQILNLSGCKGLTVFAPLADLHGLQRLRLSGCERLTDLAPLAGLQELQTLDLSSCEGVTDLTLLASLKELQSLDLSSCARVTDLAPLAGLQGLQSLKLWGCAGVTELAPLAGLKELQTLDLSRCKGVTDLAPLAGLKELQTLDLSSCKGVTDLAPLAGLQGLQSLNLWGCEEVTDLAPLAGLHGLRTLDVSHMKVTDLAPLAGLHGLRTLEVSHMKVTDLAPLAGLHGLQSLKLWGCMEVTDLAPLASLKGLQSLDLSLCYRVIELAPLAALHGLQSLDLYGCGPVPAKMLQGLADHPHLTHLTTNDAVGVPREVLSHGIADNCLPRLRAHLSEVQLGAEAETEVKVILLGNGRVGKTQLCRRFRGQPFDESVRSTHGVQIWREELRLLTQGQEQAFQVNWWDFGGQDIYHGTHALFLRNRAVFLILWTPALESREEFTEDGITLRNQPLAYWLDYVRSVAGQDSPVVVVQSRCDRFADRWPAPQRTDGFGFFECCAYSAKEDLGRETLEGLLRDAMRYLLERSGAAEIGRGRAAARRQLYEWRSADQGREPQERLHRTLTLDEFRALCDGVGGIVSWEHALDYFHQTGVVFHRPDLFSDCIVLDQDWALDAVYSVFHRGRAVPWLRDSGRFTREDLAWTVWQKHSVEEQHLFLGLMESCGVCFRCGETAEGEPRYVAPDLLPRFAGIAGRLHAWREEADTPALRLEYRFFHPAVIRRLMSRVGEQAADLAEYWKYGLWFKDGRRDTQLLVQFEDTSTDQAPGTGALVLKAQGRDPLGLLREIRRVVYMQAIGEQPEQLLTLAGVTVAQSALAGAIGGLVLDPDQRPVAAGAFASFFADRDDSSSLVRGGESLAIDIAPLPLSEGDKPPEVFISYAWGDDSAAGKVRAQAVDRLYAALGGDGFFPVRDREQIRAGDRISAFLRRLTRADLVVAVISDKYLRSAYCMYEIYKLWQGCQGEADDLLQRLVPIVLPEVRIANVGERATYLRHWAQEAREAEALVGDPDIILTLSGESLREVRLLREFAQHVDEILIFLADILMPRKLEVHLDEDFQQVRDAIRRRIEAAG
jgi:internalin A